MRNSSEAFELVVDPPIVSVRRPASEPGAAPSDRTTQPSDNVTESTGAKTPPALSEGPLDLENGTRPTTDAGSTSRFMSTAGEAATLGATDRRVTRRHTGEYLFDRSVIDYAQELGDARQPVRADITRRSVVTDWFVRHSTRERQARERHHNRLVHPWSPLACDDRSSVIRVYST